MNFKVDPSKRNPGNSSRRGFISSCTACGACMAISPLSVFGSSGSTTGSVKMKIRVIYSLHALVQPKPDWPNIGFDFKPAIENINTVLKKQFPSFEFISTLATGQEDAKKIIEGDKNENIDGYIVYQMNCWNKVIQTISETGKPILYVDFKYAGSGGFLKYNSYFLKEKQSNVGFVCSSRIEDVTAAVKCFEITAKGGSVADFVAATALTRIKLTSPSGKLSFKKDELKTLSTDESLRKIGKSKILVFKDQSTRSAEPIFGIPLEYLPFSELNQAWEAADKKEAEAIAKRWQSRADKVIGVSFKELQNSAAMYLGMKSVLNKHNANAITVNCLGGFYGNHIHAYPCLGFHELNNEGLVGACEADINSTATMVAFSTVAKGRPGFISDPVIDTSKRQIIYAHCVAPNKIFGPDGPTNPYKILTHSEDRQGAAVASILPVGYITTSLQVNNDRKEILFHQAIAVDNDPDDRACRTKLCAEPIGDIEKLFTMWNQWGWHRVTFYGDLKKQVYELANAKGWKVVEEA